MSKKLFVFALLSVLFVYGCTKNSDSTMSPAAAGGSANASNSLAMKGLGVADQAYSASIPVDSANRMIESYLYSVNYPSDQTQLRSLSFSADSLRKYLENTDIKTVKFMLAHQPAYINSGHFGENAGMNPEAITVVIVGADATGKFKLNNQKEVYEHCSPCPVLCDQVTTPYITK